MGRVNGGGLSPQQGSNSSVDQTQLYDINVAASQILVCASYEYSSISSDFLQFFFNLVLQNVGKKTTSVSEFLHYSLLSVIYSVCTIMYQQFQNPMS